VNGRGEFIRRINVLITSKLMGPLII